MKWNKLLAVVLCGTLLAGCGTRAMPDGSGSVAPETEMSGMVVKEIAASEFAAFGGCAALELPGRMAAAAASASSYDATAAFTAFSGSSAQAWQKLLDGELEVVLAYEPSAEQKKQLEEQEILMQPVGTDALVFLVGSAPEQDMTLDLSKQDILAAYQGEEGAAWKGYAAAPGSDSRLLFADLFGTDSAGVTVTDGSDTLTAACPHTNGTLCYTTYLSLQQNGQPENTMLASVDGSMPGAQTLREPGVSEQAYPLQVTYYVACRAGLDENDPAMLLYRWLTSEDGMNWLYTATIHDMQEETADTEDVP